LSYDLDVVGVRAGKLRIRWLPDVGGASKIAVDTHTNTFFENVRQMKATATSYLDPKTLRPSRYREDAVENSVNKWAEVRFRGDRGQAIVDYAIGKREVHRAYPQTTGPNDLLSIVYYLRSLDFVPKRQFCVDVYANRNLWRVRAEVVGEEWVPTPAGKFKAWRLQGEGQRLDRPSIKKKLFLWISSDKFRIPIAIMGEIDLGPVSATLSKIAGLDLGPKATENVIQQKW